MECSVNYYGVTVTPNSSGGYGNSMKRLLQYMKLLGRGLATYLDYLLLLCVSKFLYLYGCYQTENFHSFQNCNRVSFLIELQKVYVTNLNNNFRCPSKNSQFHNVLSGSSICTEKKRFWLVLGLWMFWKYEGRDHAIFWQRFTYCSEEKETEFSNYDKNRHYRWLPINLIRGY